MNNWINLDISNGSGWFSICCLLDSTFSQSNDGLIRADQLESIIWKTQKSQIATQKPEKETKQLSAFYMEQLESHPDITVNDENTKTWSQLARFYQGNIQEIFLIGTIYIF